MKQKKRNVEQDKPAKKKAAESEKITAEGKNKENRTVLQKNIVCMLFVILGTGRAVFIGSLYTGVDLYGTVRNLVLCLLAALAAVFSFQAGRISGSFFYDDGDHPGRFISLYFCGILCSLLFTQLPVTGWMFLFFYVALARVSDSVTGICAGTSLLMLTAILCEQMSLSIFLVYLLSGMIGIALFAHQKNEFYIAVPLGLSLGSQLLLLFAEELLVQNKKMIWQEAMRPFANTVMNGILIAFFLPYYIRYVAKRVDNLYLMLNDQEYTVLTELQRRKKEDYDCVVYTADLTERITSELGLDVRSAKCAAYYGHLPADELEGIPFPEPVLELISELTKGGKALKSKEAVVVQICYQVIQKIQRNNRRSRGKKMDCRRLINQMFDKIYTVEVLAETDITLSDLRLIKKRLLEEKSIMDI